MSQSNALSDMRNLFDRINETNELLTSALQRHYRVRDTNVFTMAVRQSYEQTPDRIEPDLRQGVDALRIGNWIIRLMDYADEIPWSLPEKDTPGTTAIHQHAKTSIRCPGVIPIDETTLPLGQELMELRRHRFARLYAKLGATDWTRRRNMARISPRFCYAHITRAPTVLPASPRRIAFTWARGTTGTRRITRAKLIARLQLHLEHGPLPSDYDDWRGRIIRQLHALERYPATKEFVIRSALPAHPRANISFWDGTSVMRSATLPFLIPISNEHPAPIIRPLPVLTVSNEAYRRGRPNIVRLDPIIPELDLYEH
ncbi:MAG: DNA replication terminus site-binding protein [Gammaproteobacteria bacterium]